VVIIEDAFVKPLAVDLKQTKFTRVNPIFAVVSGVFRASIELAGVETEALIDARKRDFL
jgi:hypothetical protein